MPQQIPPVVVSPNTNVLELPLAARVHVAIAQIRRSFTGIVLGAYGARRTAARLMGDSTYGTNEFGFNLAEFSQNADPAVLAEFAKKNTHAKIVGVMAGMTGSQANDAFTASDVDEMKAVAAKILENINEVAPGRVSAQLIQDVQNI